MRQTAARPALALTLATLAVSGCAYGSLTQVLRTEVAAELDCTSVSVEPRNPAYLRGVRDGDDQWKVRGCGVVRTYTCPDSGMVSYGDTGCTFVEGDVDAPELATDEGDDLLADEPAPTDAPADAPEPGDDMGDELGGDSEL